MSTALDWDLRPPVVGKAMAARAADLGCSPKQVDHWVRIGLLDVKSVGPGFKRDWTHVTGRHIAACSLVQGSVPLASAGVKRVYVDTLVANGHVSIPAGRCGRIILELRQGL